ncbi:hypothetical protein LOOC260_112870 [Paucilactobacillus hokkaidonensis JCM 18461]|uniref:DUF1516 family protein n=1 Tax=Paucilactobacillus hokkaidonensis JCM 18461 TaxID=1291742 RepID=A0A0A1GY50_9LACO|nr:DUF1516 family protein [Paucilactobacillus hokkaidonensis]BAP85824.1 hypothetical protein LOOC260_112870 [Paucilactobacillus hokkaidonensis JCM 18461]
MWTIINLTIAIVLIVTVIIGLTAKSQKQVKKWMTITRCLYLLLLITGVVILFYLFPIKPLVAILKFALAICLVVLIEMSFAKKQEQSMTIGLSAVLSLFFILVIACGYYL